jgi:CheY-like chemotaxis protein
MPEMTGYDLLKAIKVNHHHPLCIPHLTSTPVIFQSNWMLNPLNCQALSSPNPIPVVVMSSENEPQRISR